MSSKSIRDRIDFSSVPTTLADVTALEAARKLDRMDPRQYLQFLLAFSAAHRPTRTIPPRHEPFTF